MLNISAYLRQIFLFLTASRDEFGGNILILSVFIVESVLQYSLSINWMLLKCAHVEIYSCENVYICAVNLFGSLA